MDEVELLKLKELLVNDAIAAIKQQNELHQANIESIVGGAVKKVDSFESRMHSLESQRNLIIKGAVVYASVIACLIGSGWGWIKSKIHLG